MLIKKILIILFLALPVLYFVPKTSAQVDFECTRNAILNGQDPAVVCQPGGDVPEPSQKPDLNLFDIEWTPDGAGLARLVRSAVTVSVAVLFLLAVGYGLVGMFMHSTAGDNEDKVKESAKILKNALLGIVVLAAGLIVVQILSVMLGLGNVWEFRANLDAKADHCDPANGLTCSVDQEEGGECNGGTCCLYKFEDGVWVKDEALCTEF